ncbi:hypothetical protein K505DRAFT_361520 [Melanomma pulvis-pyrius CBS 109.77]|uniref:MFS general substrate transporter n=1 Tax=Melanomma pulvis-pyrius CBS 109.77 TaxID=1314802 RepID=A0A6A6XDG3_9PLEO|nr:hypothetical protein K505DRAFT_361520 [Melanomma pulvis-pyrius CBS 109.77]
MVHLLAIKHAGKENTGNAFYLINIAYMFGELLAPAVVSITMDILLTIPFALALGYLIVAGAITSTIPNHPNGSEVVPSDEDNQARQEPDPVAHSINQYVQSLSVVTKNRSILPSLPIFFVGMFRMALRIRFDWKISQVTTLFTATAVLDLVIFLAIVSYWLRYINSKHSTPEIGTALFAISQITRPPLLAFATVSVPESVREDLYGLT